jgi:hypothetical protein
VTAEGISASLTFLKKEKRPFSKKKKKKILSHAHCSDGTVDFM